MPAKSDYVKVIEVVKQIMKRTQRGNKLISIQVQTEDEKLKSLIENFLRNEKETGKASGGFLVKGNPDGSERDKAAYAAWEAFHDALKAMVGYCEDIIASSKPQWQVLAERNGWGSTPKAFQYKGITFHPIRTLKGKEDEFSAIAKRQNDIGLTPEGWSHGDFYAEATKAGAGEIDLFEMNGYVVIPCENYLFQYK